MFISCFDDFVQNNGSDFFDLRFEILTDDFVQFAQGLSEIGVKVVLYTVVSSECTK